MEQKELMEFATLLPSFILVVSAFEDIRHKKVQNKVVLAMAALVLGYLAFQGEAAHWTEAFLGLFTAFLILVPLYIMRALGAGDVKVFMVVGLATGPSQILSIFMYSLFVALVFGFILVVLNKKVKIFFENIKQVITLQKPEPAQLQTIPFTVALFAGWVCHLTATYYGRAL